LPPIQEIKVKKRKKEKEGRGKKVAAEPTHDVIFV